MASRVYDRMPLFVFLARGVHLSRVHQEFGGAGCSSMCELSMSDLAVMCVSEHSCSIIASRVCSVFSVFPDIPPCQADPADDDERRYKARHALSAWKGEARL